MEISVYCILMILNSMHALFMSRPARPADNVHTIQLPLAGCSIPEGTMCKMYGWGETKGINNSHQYSLYACITCILCLLQNM